MIFNYIFSFIVKIKLNLKSGVQRTKNELSLATTRGHRTAKRVKEFKKKQKTIYPKNRKRAMKTEQVTIKRRKNKK